MVAGLNLSGLSSGTVHRAVGVSSAGRVHDASWDTESLFLTLQVLPSYHPCPSSSCCRYDLVITPVPLPHAAGYTNYPTAILWSLSLTPSRPCAT